MEGYKQEKKLTLNERINEIWKTTEGKTYTTAIATIVVVVLMTVFAIVPAYVSITDQIALNEQKTKYLNDVSIKQNTLNTLINQRDEQTLSIELLDVYFKNKMNNELFVASFSKIAEDNKCKMNGVSFTDPVVSKNIKELNPNVKAVGFSLMMNCKISDMKAVYDSMLSFPIPLLVKNITYTNKKDQGGGGTSNFLYDRFAITISGEYFFWNNTLTK